MLSDKRILLGITGGIAAYKIPQLIRLIQKQNGSVRCIVTPAAGEFVTPATLSTLCRHQVYSDLFASRADIDHIELARWADAFVIAPLTANTLAKLAHGFADNLLTATALSFQGRMLVAPAMNHAMWGHASVQENISTLAGRGITILEPGEGELACGESGKGRMQEVEDILEWIIRACTPPFLAGKKVLVTAGPTREHIDPVRYISNSSSGKMGFSLARAAWYASADVTLVSGPSSEKSIAAIQALRVISSEEMFYFVKKYFPSSDLFISNAAVADFQPARKQSEKIPKQNVPDKLELNATPDILAWAGTHKKRQTLLGFALETENEEQNARSKLIRKKCDYIAMNRTSAIGEDRSSLVLYDAQGKKRELSDLPKPLLARALLLMLFSNDLKAAP